MKDDLLKVEGIGDITAQAYYDYFIHADDDFYELLGLMDFDIPNTSMDEIGANIKCKSFVITGSLIQFKNRDELVAKIESMGGKVSGSVSKNTDYLINNDKLSTSGKNKKAMELNVKIISEEDFLQLTM
jgi:DNA ligase (NAD+)